MSGGPGERTVADPGRGRFLVLEGIDGCGKTTQLEALSRWLPDSGLLAPGTSLLVTREPGGTALGLALRELLLHPPGEAAPDPLAELLLYAADRAQHVRQRIEPALAAGDWVLSDRFVGSTAAYQGDGRGLPLEWIASLEALATAGLEADLTLWLDLPLECSLQRRGHRAADRIESAGGAFLERVATGFARLATERGWSRIDADQNPELVSQAIGQVVEQHFSPAPRSLGLTSGDGHG
ncbi:dTMP kinase [Cyanobium sp. Morenito 9A2]|uniref:dTMP kinase n=1 Tax=Cyanobium sp. Morenito 9A2 TaxID=2823718 RepID=UPI0020CE62B2|nr:dTMP kinase [Cyanobium sp. Morenito 9A2]MCP9849892.1 dTMP kinase [Cyanobium sp. Morenito 9A2]